MTEGWRDEMSCKELVELVTDYLEESLDDAIRDRFQAHLVGCPGCAEYLEQMRVTLRLAGSLEPETVPEDALEKLMEAFRGWRDT